jgi:hypothetical protein
VLTYRYVALGHTLVAYCLKIFYKNKQGPEILDISFNKWVGILSGLLVAIYAGTNLACPLIVATVTLLYMYL